jgi:hypothetical protein
MTRRALVAADMFLNMATEAEMQATITELVERKHGRVFHIRDSRFAPEMEAFPDLVIICPPILAIVELKSIKRRVTPNQQAVLDLLEQCTGLVTGIFRPYDLDDLLEVIR